MGDSTEITPRELFERLVLVGPKGAVSKNILVGISQDQQVHSLDVFYRGAYQDQLNALIPQDLQPRVEYTGNVPYYSTIDYYRKSAILVNPSLSEAFGRSLIEANACGLPVVSVFETADMFPASFVRFLCLKSMSCLAT